jgi:L1 cell adhesion molecule like protein
VGWQDGDWTVVNAAFDQAACYPDTTFYDLKHMFGWSSDMPVIREAKKSWLFPITRGPEGEILLPVHEGDQHCLYRPYQLAAKIFDYQKTEAQTELLTIPTRVVLSVPAYCNEAQRDETKKAAEEAGFEVIKLIKEPSAGAIAFGREILPTQARNVAVIDLGGGTFDVSIMTIQPHRFDVKAVSSDSDLTSAAQALMKVVNLLRIIEIRWIWTSQACADKSREHLYLLNVSNSGKMAPCWFEKIFM